MNYSPLLSIITATLEIAAALYGILLIKKKQAADWSIIVILMLLAGYQILEALNCSPGLSGMFSRAAFIDITWLPPLGLVFLALAIPRASSRIIAGIYVLAGLAFSVWYAFFDTSVILSHCDTVIAVYTNSEPGRWLYAVFYQSGVLLLIILPFFFPRRVIGGADSFGLKNIRYFQLGVLGFMLPSLVTALIFTSLQRAMPSLMCHYALILAGFLFLILRNRRRSAA
ncbi:hypothetical protein [Salinispira pacifica]|uniref:Histidine kinase N-terminal 7TM region domain-containing protein n=1 Tax=Salinispira pacifica TaxID=1307761 RepID=V5WNS0_9SPIO|nr:hypothetical protein [Salinispira pacifica]AHC16726.1 hypothetical protein L21SP2_3388 [Salinispira pacifica]